MEVGASDPARLADTAYLVAKLDLRAGGDVDRVHVAIQTDEAVAVIEDDGVAIEKIVAGASDNPRGGCVNRRAFVGGDIHTRMWGSRFAIEEASVSERAAAYAGDWRCHRKGWFQCFVPATKCSVHFCTLGTYAHHIFCIGVHLALVFDCETLLGIGLVLDAEA